MTQRKFFVLGLHDAGKTTFAAALWHLVDSREIPTKLSKGAHVGEFRYLEKITQARSEGWQIGRTNKNDVETVKINLVDPETSEAFVLEFTDLAGETFEAAFS